MRAKIADQIPAMFRHAVLAEKLEMHPVTFSRKIHGLTPWKHHELDRLEKLTNVIFDLDREGVRV